MEEKVVVECPKSFLSNERAYVFLLKGHKMASRPKVRLIIWDMTKTRSCETNLLAMLFYIFEQLYHCKKTIYVYLPNGDKLLYQSSVMDIFQYYASDKRSFFKPRLVGNYNIRETEDLLVKYLKSLHLKQYNIIKTLISEMIANVKMHTIYREGMIAGYLSERRNCIILSIANYDYSIPRQIECRSKMIFESDFEAIMWSLKKSNSTRDRQETGGLGLYLLRKYITQLGGKASIMSGNCYMEMDEECYDSEDENKIRISRMRTLEDSYEGTIITLFIPYDVETEEKVLEEKKISTFIDLADI